MVALCPYRVTDLLTSPHSAAIVASSAMHLQITRIAAALKRTQW
jgi:hypothetical protein